MKKIKTSRTSCINGWRQALGLSYGRLQRPGDLSSGTVIADGGDVVNAGYEQAYYQQMTVQSANVDAGKVILFIFRPDSVNSDYSINATIKYHLR